MKSPLFSFLFAFLLGCVSPDRIDIVQVPVETFVGTPFGTEDCRLEELGFDRFSESLRCEYPWRRFRSAGKLMACGMLGSSDGSRWIKACVGNIGESLYSDKWLTSHDGGLTWYGIRLMEEDALVAGINNRYFVFAPRPGREPGDLDLTYLYLFDGCKKPEVCYWGLPPVQHSMAVENGIVVFSDGWLVALLEKTSDKITFCRWEVEVDGVCYNVGFIEPECDRNRVIATVRCMPKSEDDSICPFRYGIVLSRDGGISWQLVKNPSSGSFLIDSPYESCGLGDGGEICFDDGSKYFIVREDGSWRAGRSEGGGWLMTVRNGTVLQGARGELPHLNPYCVRYASDGSSTDDDVSEACDDWYVMQEVNLLERAYELKRHMYEFPQELDAKGEPKEDVAPRGEK